MFVFSTFWPPCIHVENKCFICKIRLKGIAKEALGLGINALQSHLFKNTSARRKLFPLLGKKGLSLSFEKIETSIPNEH